MNIGDYFSINVFFIIFRETLECVIIVSVLLAFLEQNQRSSDAETHPGLLRKLRLQVWFGALCGIILCLLIGGLFILAFYWLDLDLWSKSEHYWEGVFSILASAIISIMGFGMLQLSKLEKKWHLKLGQILDAVATTRHVEEQELLTSSEASRSSKFRKWKQQVKGYTSKNVLFILPFVTTLRECLESIVFIGGIGVTEESSTFLLSIITGMAVGTAIGMFIYRSGTSSVSSQKFMIYSTSFLYIISAGLMAKGVWQFELQRFIDKCDGLDVSEVGSGPGSYDVDNSVWHVNCCNGEVDGPWMILTAIFGWCNSATYGSVLSYIFYWLVISGAFRVLRFENRNGYLPWIPLKWQLRKIKKNYVLLSSLKKQDDLEASRQPAISTDDVNAGLLQ